MRWLTILLCSVALADDWYVSPAGSDSNPGTVAEPFLTATAARDAIRADTPSDGHTVYFRAGYHFLSLALEAADSGGASTPVVWRNYPTEEAIIVGGLPITNLVSIGGGLYEADLSTQGFSGITFRDLYFNGERQTMARYPNVGSWSYVQSGANSTLAFTNAPGDIKATWANITDAEVFIFPGISSTGGSANWDNGIKPIASWDSGTRLVTLTAAPVNTYKIGPNDRYFVQNVAEELDAPGEWILASDTLTFYPPTHPADTPLWAPTGGHIITISTGTSNVWIRGLKLTGADDDAINIAGTASHNRVLGCKILQTGSWDGTAATTTGGFGVYIAGGVSNIVQACDFDGIGFNAIALNGGTVATRTPTGHLADNNWIQDTGKQRIKYGGIQWTGVGHTITHNYIHDMPRSGIHGSSGNDTVIAYNWVTNAVTETDDMGGIYIVGNDWTTAHGTVVATNLVTDCVGYGFYAGAYGSTFTSASCYYFDGRSNGIDMHHNVGDRGQSMALFMQWGRHHRVWNNILRNSTGRSAVLDSTPPSVSATYTNGWFAIKDAAEWQAARGIGTDPNLWEPITYSSGDLGFWTNIVQSTATLSETRLQLSMLPSNSYTATLYHRSNGTAGSANFNLTASATYGEDFAYWTNAIPEATALYGDPLIQADYTVDAGSPALTLGFEQIDLSDVGLYSTEYRVALEDEQPPIIPPPVVASGTRATFSNAILRQVQ